MLETWEWFWVSVSWIKKRDFLQETGKTGHKSQYWVSVKAKLLRKRNEYLQFTRVLPKKHVNMKLFCSKVHSLVTRMEILSYEHSPLTNRIAQSVGQRSCSKNATLSIRVNISTCVSYQVNLNSFRLVGHLNPPC